MRIDWYPIYEGTYEDALAKALALQGDDEEWFYKVEPSRNQGRYQINVYDEEGLIDSWRIG